MRPETTLSYRPDVDGLRAVAVLGVIAFHASPAALPGGFAGVDVFFVISGFLISGIVFEQLEAGRFSLWNFYARRARRILPALLLVIAVTLLCGWRLLLPDELRELGKEAAGGAGFVANLVFWEDSNYFTARDSFRPLLNLWSLGVEEQFYVVWPLILVLMFRLRAGAWAAILPIGLASLYFSAWTANYDPVSSFYLPMSRFWELLAGALLAWFTYSHRGRAAVAAAGAFLPSRLLTIAGNVAAFAGIGLVAASMTCITEEMPFPGWLALPPVGGAFLLIAAGPRAWVNRWLLAHPAMVFVGLVSYPLYLWHWPALIFTRALSLGPPPPAAIAAAVAASFLLAWLTYRFVEIPIRSRRGTPMPAALLAGAIVATTLGIAVMRSDGYPDRYPPDIRAILDVRTDNMLAVWRHRKCFLPARQTARAFQPECVDPAPGPIVVIWGDSHGAALYAGARQLDSRLRLAQFTVSDCLPILDVATESPTCQHANNVAIANIRALRPRIVLVHGQWNNRWKSYSDGAAISATLRSVKAAGAEVVLVGPTPRWTESLPRILLAYSRRDLLWRLPERMSEHLDPQVPEIDRALRSIALKAGVPYISAYDLLCANGCLTRVGTQLSAVDQGHLSQGAAAFVLREGVTGAGLSLPRPGDG
jgi:peptidoglycan/LPS O-acetylase OafA/YrhL